VPDAIPVFTEYGAGSFADRIGKLALSLVGGVQVDQRGEGTAMAHPVYQLTKTRALIGGKGLPGMSQVVKVNPGQAGRRAVNLSTCQEREQTERLLACLPRLYPGC
jgi:hypothetical protein